MKEIIFEVVEEKPNKKYCSYCGTEMDSLLFFKCKYCKECFCVKCHLPENHECKGQYKYNIFSRLFYILKIWRV